MNKCLVLLLICCLSTPIIGQEAMDIWVKQKMDAMSIDQKIGQLFTIRAHSNLGQEHINSVKSQIKKYEVGGLCFFQGTPEKQAELTNSYQQLSKIPLLISIDGEWGLGMRFPKSSISFPRQLTLGAIQNDNLIFEMGKEIAYQMKRIGVHMNYAPVSDVNNNADNPVINNRSFGENRFKVAAKSYAYMKGMQKAGLLTCTKHFPGHGDTATDSHHDLPIIPHNRRRLDSIELMPFQNLIDQGVDGVMVAHLQMPALDDRPNRPTTLSKNVITKLLREEMKFDGLIISDAMEMSGVTKHYKNGSAELEALMAGMDIVLLPPDIDESFIAIKAGLENGQLKESDINEKLKRILEYKFKAGLHRRQFIPSISNIKEDINSNRAMGLRGQLIEKSLTLVKNDSNVIPLRNANDKKVAVVSFGTKNASTFQKRVGQFTQVTQFHMTQDALSAQLQNLKDKIAGYEIILVSIEDMSKYSSKNFGLQQATIDFINGLATDDKQVILSLFGSPYALKYFESVPNILLAYEDDAQTQDITAQSLFGVNEINGKLPVTASAIFNEGDGLYSPSISRLGFALPEQVGLSSDSLLAIDTIVQEMIRRKAAPGCQMLIAKDGKIVMHAAYGYHTYDRKRKVKKDDVYDLASVTKVMASTISIMKLHEQEKLNIYQPLVNYIPEADTSNKKNIIIEDLLAHHAGLAGWVPFYKNTIIEKKRSVSVDPKYYRNTASDSFSLKVIDNLFLRSDYRDSIWSRILGTQLKQNRKYRYSDLGFYMMHEAIHNITGKPVDLFAHETFYQPLGLQKTMYNPLTRLNSSIIPPTEKDNYFRGEVVDGYVHDMGAAMLGGVSGHAGLFSNSQELAVLMQMLLNGGSYAGKQYLDPKTVNLFTKRYYRSTRRGLGFDMKELDEDRKMNMSEKASASTFGHLGFTGTCVWADPEHDIIFIFLSNRTYPSMNNNTFGKYDFRPRIQTVVYDALIDKKQKQRTLP